MRVATLWVDADSKKRQICVVHKTGTLFLLYTPLTQGGAHPYEQPLWDRRYNFVLSEEITDFVCQGSMSRNTCFNPDLESAVKIK